MLVREILKNIGYARSILKQAYEFDVRIDIEGFIIPKEWAIDYYLGKLKEKEINVYLQFKEVVDNRLMMQDDLLNGKWVPVLTITKDDLKRDELFGRDKNRERIFKYNVIAKIQADSEGEVVKILNDAKEKLSKEANYNIRPKGFVLRIRNVEVRIVNKEEKPRMRVSGFSRELEI